jgi:hypothetical protein
MFGPIARNLLDVCGVVVAICVGNVPKGDYRYFAELLQLHPSRRRETSFSIISRR